MSRELNKNSVSSVLGCARNLVDSEVMAGLLRRKQISKWCKSRAIADVVLVNTCGFIGAAKEESIDTILEISRLKEDGQVKKLIVAGCLSQRYPEELADELPEVDFFIGTGEVPRIAEILREHEAQRHAATIRRRSELHLRSRHAAAAHDAVLHGVSKGLGRVRSQVRLLHHPATARPASQPLHRFGGSRSHDTGPRRRQRNQSHRPGSHRLRPRPKRRHHALRSFARNGASAEARLDSACFMPIQTSSISPCLN